MGSTYVVMYMYLGVPMIRAEVAFRRDSRGNNKSGERVGDRPPAAGTCTDGNEGAVGHFIRQNVKPQYARTRVLALHTVTREKERDDDIDSPQ